MTEKKRIQSFAAFGIELEYMLVDRESLQVRAVADRVLATAAGKPTSDFESGPITWSNELALHVLEIKVSKPTSDLVSLADRLQLGIQQLQPALEANNVQLLPTGMHPWMDPTRETQLWPHECAEIYQAYHNLFNCHSHGWSNVQSVHLNLPFADDEQFARLHAAVRIILPILPALTASSPIIEGQPGPWRDTRMLKVRDHCQKIPFLTGDLVPEPIFDEATYRAQIFARLKQVIQPHDPAGVFAADFLNSRGAIARFDRGSIEIRVMDVQECPAFDIAVCVAVIAVLKMLVSEKWQPLAEQQSQPTKPLAKLLKQTSESAEATVIDDPSFLRQFGVSGNSIRADDLWRHILTDAGKHEPMLNDFTTQLKTILQHGSLATRIVNSVDGEYRPERLREIYRLLTGCLVSGKPFLP